MTASKMDLKKCSHHNKNTKSRNTLKTIKSKSKVNYINEDTPKTQFSVCMSISQLTVIPLCCCASTFKSTTN